MSNCKHIRVASADHGDRAFCLDCPDWMEEGVWQLKGNKVAKPQSKSELKRIRIQSGGKLS